MTRASQIADKTEYAVQPEAETGEALAISEPSTREATDVVEAPTPRPWEMRNIYRKISNDGTAWQVGFSRSPPERTYNKNFADSRYGSEEKALAAAQAWRDEMVRLHPPQTKQYLSLQRRKNNASGKPGVWRITIRLRRADGREVTHARWQAASPAWVGPKRTRSFSVIKHGELEARRLAIAAREAFEAEMAQTITEPPVYRKSAPRPPDSDLRNLRRLKRARGMSWGASVKRSTEGRRFTRVFPDAQFGGEAEALVAARAWRDEIERKHPLLPKKERLVRLRSSNTSGKTGVQRLLSLVRRLDGSEYVVAYWKAVTPSGVTPRRSRSFSVDKLGEQDAYRLAVEARLAFEALLGDD